MLINVSDALSKRFDGTLLLGYGDTVTFGGVPLRVSGSIRTLGMLEKSPSRIACGMVVAVDVLVVRDLKPSKFDMKNRRFLPLKIFGIRTGPLRVKPY